MWVDNVKMGLIGILRGKVAAWRWFIICGLYYELEFSASAKRTLMT
jgi:hypothetical protein